jgi:Arc/MetJ-type ribon-helix-helix transcriptional regulator
MVSVTATAKITITVENEQIDAIRELVAAGRAASASDFIRHAVRNALFDAAGGKAMLEDAPAAIGRTADERRAGLGRCAAQTARA